MKLLDDVKKILDGYDLKVDIPKEYENVYDFVALSDEDADAEVRRFYSDKTDFKLYEKYKEHVPRGWYGFSLGTPTPVNWIDAIDNILTLLISKDPDFKIMQIKMKFGGVRFYTASDVIDDLFDIETLIEDRMYDKKLIY